MIELGRIYFWPNKRQPNLNDKTIKKYGSIVGSVIVCIDVSPTPGVEPKLVVYMPEISTNYNSTIMMESKFSMPLSAILGAGRIGRFRREMKAVGVTCHVPAQIVYNIVEKVKEVFENLEV